MKKKIKIVVKKKKKLPKGKTLKIKKSYIV